MSCPEWFFGRSRCYRRVAASGVTRHATRFQNLSRRCDDRSSQAFAFVPFLKSFVEKKSSRKGRYDPARSQERNAVITASCGSEYFMTNAQCHERAKSSPSGY
jgi:hypothetical protein